MHRSARWFAVAALTHCAALAGPVIAAGEATKPVGGEPLIGEMSRAIGAWVKVHLERTATPRPLDRSGETKR